MSDQPSRPAPPVPARPWIEDWRTRPSTGSALACLDGLRGLAILMVVAHHTFYTNPAAGWFSRVVGGLLGAGWMGVPLFFVLSGFLISHGLLRATAREPGAVYPGGYLRRRLAKIGPPFLLSLLVFGLAQSWLHRDPLYWLAALQSLLGLINFLPPVRDINGVYWSLIVEVQFYLFLPVALWGAHRLWPRIGAPIVAFAMLGVAPVARVLTWLATPDPALAKYLMPRFPNQLDFFGYGLLFALLYTRLAPAPEAARRRWARLGYLGALGWGGVMAWWTWLMLTGDPLGHPTLGNTMIHHAGLGLSAFLLLFFTLDAANPASRLLGWAPLCLVGLVSYEWFLFHGPPMVWLRDWIGQAGGNRWLFHLRTTIPFTLTFAFAALLYRSYSLPLLRKMRAT